MSDAPPPLAQVLPPKHYCNVTFLSIGDVGPDGLPIKRLLCCTRCRETYYCGKVQQRRHWRVHRFVCRPAREEAPEESFAGLSVGTVAESIIRIIRDNCRTGRRPHKLCFKARRWVAHFCSFLKGCRFCEMKNEITQSLEQMFHPP